MKFDLLLCDVPWSYRDKACAGERGAAFKYPVLTLKDLAALPVQDLAKPNCALAMWVTNPMLPDGIWLMEKWGFKFRTVLFHWRKVTKTDPHAPAWGMGHWTRCLRGDTEITVQLDCDYSVKKIRIDSLVDHSFDNIKIWTIGGWKRILGYTVNENTETLRIRTYLGDIICSGNHRFLAKVPVNRRYHGGTRKVEYKTDFYTANELEHKLRLSYIKTGRHVVQLSNSSAPVESEYPILFSDAGIKLNYETGWFLGLYLAEGSVYSRSNINQVKFALHSCEVDEVKMRAAMWLTSMEIKNERYFNMPLRVRSFVKDNKGYVFFAAKKIKEFFESLSVGGNCHDRRLNLELIRNTTVRFREGIIHGVFWGDGTLAQGNYPKMVLCNKGLVKDLEEVSRSIGMLSSAQEQKPRLKGDTLCERHLLHMGTRGVGTGYKYNDVELNMVRIDSIESTGIKENTIDICVDGETFIANDMIVHNSNLELCLLGVRGRPKRASAGVHAEISAERRTHSSKPVMVRKRLEILFGDVARCELFARAEAPGWRALGDELDGRDIREALPDLAREGEQDAAQPAL